MEQRIVCLVCRRRFDGLDSKGLQWMNPLTQEVVASPANRQMDVGYAEWRDKGYELYCDKGHLLPQDPHLRPLLVLTTFGQSQAGKGGLVRKVASLLRNGETARQGVQGSVHDLHALDFDDRYGPGEIPATDGATADAPRQPDYLTITDSRHGPVNLAIFDTGYEDAATTRRAKEVVKYLAEVDILVFFVPPGALDLPDHVKFTDSEPPHHDGPGTRKVIDSILEAFGSGPAAKARAQRRMVYIVLSKADRYLGLEDFPQDLLRDRPYRAKQPSDFGADMAAEQALLFDFMESHGGLPLLEAARTHNGTVFLTAVSGTGSDQRGAAPAAESAPNRALDPIVAALMRAGRGGFGQTS